MALNHLSMASFSSSSSSSSSPSSSSSLSLKLSFSLYNTETEEISSSENTTFTSTDEDDHDQLTTLNLFNHPCIHDVVNNENRSRFSKLNDHRKRKIPELTIDCWCSSSEKHDTKKSSSTDDQEGNRSVSSIDDITKNITFSDEDQITTLKLFDHPYIDINPVAKIKENRINDRKRKIPKLYDFWSSSKKHDEKETDEQEPESNETCTELQLCIGLVFNEPSKKRKKALSEPNNHTQRPLDDGLDLKIDPPIEAIRRNAVVLPIDVQEAVPDDHWKIRKVLKKSDIDSSSRLLLGKVLVREHILPHLVDNGAILVETEGVDIPIWDADTRSGHVLVLKTWKTGSYVLKKNWTKDFVKRRSLRENDEIGLRWNDRHSRLEFTLFNGDN
ncbi:hypothetical protein BUALT_Bualt13G0051800 [Buddleja alternifolia]|uniref:B3 domain-containing protein n=1 Tax=Buddleja alternifolia TaxID=168488 RepID=A0AAV6WSN7_9LAMI|nr:hypothetical protein BUALT_Bualt13G0051800 [Buddleja alternifolia]